MSPEMNSFSFSGQIPRVIFGPGSLQYLSREIDLIGAQRALILCTPGQRAGAELVADLIGVRCAGIFDRAVMHVPLDIAGEVRDVALQVNADCVIAIGGGSTTGLGKAIALVSTLPILAIPTTYAGSEMTPIYGITDNGVKKTGRDVRVLPKTVIYDPELTVGLPASLSVTSGINAIAHAAEGLYAHDTNPVMSLFAEEGMRALVRGLPKIVVQPESLEGRGDCLYGAWLCGVVLGNVSMGLHHKLCHTLGGSFRLPHAETHTIILPHVLAYNRDAAPDAMHCISAILGAPDAARGMFDFAQSLAAPTALKDIGMQESDLDRCAKIATQDAYPNSRSIGTKEVRALLENAYWGNRP